MRVLYPDGTIFFTYILEHIVPIHWHWDRQFAYYVQHAPLITAIKLGITDVHTLARIHATWYFSFGWISLLTCYLSLPKEYKIFILFPLLWIFGVYIHVDFFPITPGRFITAIFWIVLFQIFFRGGWLSWFLVAVIAWPLLRSYQGMVILGPILSLFALIKSWLLWSGNAAIGLQNNAGQHERNRTTTVEPERSATTENRKKTGKRHHFSRLLSVFWAAAAIYFLAGASLSFISILDPQDKASFLTFILGFALFIDQYGYPSFSFLFGISTAFVVLLRLLKPSASSSLKHWFGSKFLLFFWMLMGIMTLITALFWHNAMAPETHQQLRSLNIYGTALLSVFTFIAVTTLTTGPWSYLREYFLNFIAFRSGRKPDASYQNTPVSGRQETPRNQNTDDKKRSLTGLHNRSAAAHGRPDDAVASNIGGFFGRMVQQTGRIWQGGLPGLQHSSVWSLRVMALLVVLQLIWAVSATHQWNRYLVILQMTLEQAPSGLVLAQDTPLMNLPTHASLSNGFHNDWDAPLMSILFAPNPGAIRTIIAHNYNNLYHPLDPRDLESLPDLSRYGFDLSEYIEAYLQQDPVIVPDMKLPSFLQWIETQTTGINDFFERRQ
jgi:hypothetical protein